jgi:hypothetical protein
MALGVVAMSGCGSTDQNAANQGGSHSVPSGGSGGSGGSSGSGGKSAPGGAGAINLSGSGGSASTGGDGGTPASAGAPFVPPDCDTIAFADPALEAAVRKHSGNTDTPITKGEAANIDSLSLVSGVTSLEGAECLTNINMLHVSGTFSSLEPLRGLQSLQYLS